MSSNPGHFGLVIGIDSYSSPQFNTLRGASADAGRFYDWLRAATGGGLPRQNLALLTKPRSETARHPESREATWSSVRTQIAEWKKLSNDMQQSIGTRLYIYLAGHGYNDRDNLNSVHLVLDAYDSTMAESFPGTECGLWFQVKALFDEIVLIMDCCRDRELSLTPTPLTFGNEDGVPGRKESAVRILFSYGAEYGRKSRERSLDDQGEVQGIFTKALLEGLQGGAREAGSDRITCRSLTAYLHARVPELGPATPPHSVAQRPNFTPADFNNLTDFEICSVPEALAVVPRRTASLTIEMPPPFTDVMVWDAKTFNAKTGSYSQRVEPDWHKNADGTWCCPVAGGVYAVVWIGPEESSSLQLIVVKGDVHAKP